MGGRHHPGVRTSVPLLAIVVCVLVLVRLGPVGWAVPPQQQATQARILATAEVHRCVACSAKKGAEAEMGARALTRKIRTTSTPEEVFGLMAAHGGDFNEIHLVTCLRQLAAMKTPFARDLAKSKPFGDLLFCLNYHVDVMDPFSLSNTAWSLAQLSTRVEIDCSALLRCIAARSAGTIKEFPHKSLSSLAWAFGALHHRDTAMMQAIAHQTCKVLTRFDLQGVCNVAWGFAELRYDDEELMERLARHAMKGISQLALCEMGALASSFTRLNRTHVGLSRAITSTLVDRPWERGGNHWFDHARILLASSRAKACDTSYLDLIDQKLDQSVLSTTSIYNIAAMLWACTELGCQDTNPNMLANLQAAAHHRSVTWEDINRNNLLDPLEWNKQQLGEK